jgi:hypothetical protein
MSDLSIFKQDLPASMRAEGVSALTKTLAGNGNLTSRRITVKNNAFRRLINGEEVGKLKGDLNVVIVNALPAVSRQFYAKAYDPNGEATLPDCWSNLGDVPDAKASNPQGSSCASCPQNIAGSGGGTRRACAFQRRIAVVLEGDMNGDIYQMNIASTSLFGKGEGNTHPFESYVRFLAANNKSIDRIVTTISVDEDADQTKLLFTPLRHLMEEELDVVIGAGSSSEATNVVRLTVAAQDGVKRLPKAEQEQANAEEFAAAPAPTAKVAQAFTMEEPEAIEEPVKRTTAKPTVTPEAKANLADVVSAWSDDE